MSNTLTKEEKIQFIGSSTFEVYKCAEHTGRTTKIDEDTTLSSSKVPTFRPRKEPKEAVR
ncbi:HU family DNA-binding protein [Priestia megaterium]|uniref:HU family DNA-binding protein n=1 Tax=Priestia megaterium TaxID=1404 RepID=UPI00355B46BE